MASPDWIEIYGAYSGEELTNEITALKKQLSDASGITSQGAGSKSYQRDLLHLQNRLHAAVRVQNNRSRASLPPSMNGSYGQADFSRVRV
jgi:hypothetical protein